MAALFVAGLDEYIASLEGLYDEASDINEQCMYEAAKIFADAVDAEIDNIPPESFLNKEDPEKERRELHKGLCVGEFAHTNGQISTYIDFAGYTPWRWINDKSGRYNPIPIRLVARSITRGVRTDNIFRKGDDFVGRAYKSKKKEAEEVLCKKLEDSFIRFLDNKVFDLEK